MFKPARSHFSLLLLPRLLLAAIIILLGNMESFTSSSDVVLAQTANQQPNYISASERLRCCGVRD
jgi:hypothetical protein